ncbi:MAG: hypothetical protein KZQ64_14865 [gamma proteobacterium symbiont of Bathyaustriella thionipta]|nr:hypothetical protein [gamma proteobacterium symbiont of Bathyaustriella thionipta]MCU7954651.1 hypothetical protein [gamma proteobacterium symbiont of Bathyaustriella thionipta]MCU7957445.1 hypothetical protein [gamma proteobacterium symbiont of Bathyaustriella thionipta]MCU7966101.1 hypothetical protein [gamma proteobacterium symbiont of Bathyaustriella thionipta]
MVKLMKAYLGVESSECELEINTQKDPPSNESTINEKAKEKLGGEYGQLI